MRTKFHNVINETESISTNVTANKLSPLLLSFSSPFLLRPVLPTACLPSPIAKQLRVFSAWPLTAVRQRLASVGALESSIATPAKFEEVHFGAEKLNIFRK